MNELQNAHQLVEQAFEQARRSGKPDWWLMTIPVLKNRLLQLTDRKFKEADYGARSFREFLRNVADLVELHDTPLPGHVIMRSAATADLPAEPSKAPPREIRPDLWEAVLDFSSGTRYIWDATQGEARPAREDEQAVKLPTLTADEFDGWRTAFIERHLPPDEPTLKQLQHWRDKRLPTLGMPPAYRGLWNKYLKEEVKQRIAKWFADHKLDEVPSPLISHRTPADDDLQRLRDFVVRCVQHMSRTELEGLRIPPTSVLRVLKD